MTDLGPIVRAYCQCGETAVYVFWPRRPCGKCGEHVTLDKDDLASLKN
jgi:ArsR family metal-binding transcriptional regulator